MPSKVGHTRPSGDRSTIETFKIMARGGWRLGAAFITWTIAGDDAGVTLQYHRNTSTHTNILVRGKARAGLLVLMVRVGIFLTA